MVWFKVEHANGHFYTPFKEEKTVYFEIGDNPTGGDIVRELTDRKDCMYMGDNFFEESVDDSKDETVDVVPPGVYRHKYNAADSSREGLIPFSLREDEIVELDGEYDHPVKDIEDFLDPEAEKYFKEVGVLQKMGILLYGLPGNSKSVTLRSILKKAVPTSNAVVVYVSGEVPSHDFLDKMRNTMENNLKVFIFEEITSNLVQHRSVERVLNFLDGEQSLNKMITLATTNFPEKLPENVVDRPSRFDKLYKFGPPSPENRRRLLKHFLQRDPQESEVQKTEGKSIADIKEIVTLTKVSRKTFVEALKVIEDRKRLVKGAFMEVKKVGFGG